jgi:hypothetical protein
VLDALARALRLADAERGHLFDLARTAHPVKAPPRRQAAYSPPPSSSCSMRRPRRRAHRQRPSRHPRSQRPRARSTRTCSTRSARTRLASPNHPTPRVPPTGGQPTAPKNESDMPSNDTTIKILAHHPARGAAWASTSPRPHWPPATTSSPPAATRDREVGRRRARAVARRRADGTDARGAGQAVAAAVERFGRIDVLVNNAVELADSDQPPLRSFAGEDAVEGIEQKARLLLAQIDAHRELSTSPRARRRARRRPSGRRPTRSRPQGDR